MLGEMLDGEPQPPRTARPDMKPVATPFGKNSSGSVLLKFS
jgi:hypothetical protein